MRTIARFALVLALGTTACTLLIELPEARQEQGESPLQCDADQKACDRECAPRDDPQRGCSAATCSPCFENAHASCVGGACVFDGCLAGFSDCGDEGAVRCADLDTDPDNCGACGHTCAVANGVPDCNDGVCALDGCHEGYGDCDGEPANGCELALDASSLHCGACGHTCFGGDCSAGSCDVVVLADHQGNAQDIVADGDHVFWAISAPNGSVMRQAQSNDLSQEPVETLALAQRYAHSLVVAGGTLFWAAMDGDSTTTSIRNAVTSSASTVPEPGVAAPCALELTALRGRLYWIESSYLTVGCSNRVWSVPLTGGVPELVATSNGVLTGLTSDDTYAYWSSYVIHEVVRGNSTTSPELLASPVGAPMRLASGADALFMVTAPGNTVMTGPQRIERRDLAPASGGSVPLAETPGEIPDVVADETHVYWIDASSVRRLEKSPGAEEEVLAANQSPLLMTLGADRVFWSDASDGGSIRSVAK